MKKIVIGTRTYLGADWHHVDVSAVPLTASDGSRHPVDTVCDASSHIPIGTGAAGVVYSQECLEHFSWRAYPAVLGEWARLVGPGGVLVIEVPDALAAFRQVLAPDAAAEDADPDSPEYAAALDMDRRIQQIIFGGQDNEWDFHYVGLTPRMLTAEMEKLGLAVIDVRRGWEHGHLLVVGERPCA